MTAIDRMLLEANGLAFTAHRAEPSTNDSRGTVVLVHGFPDTAGTFRHQLPVLAAAGYVAVAPTIRGYEPGSQPSDGDYSLPALAADVVGWLDHLDVERAHLVGHDWGAAAAYVAAATDPDRFASVTALAIPPLARIPDAVRRVPRQVLRSWYMTWFQTRRLAELSVTAGGGRFLERLWRSWSPGYGPKPEDLSPLQATFDRPGVVAAALSYYRQNATPSIMLGLAKTPAMTPTPIDAPTLIVSGADDGCIDRRLFNRCIEQADFSAGVDHHELAGAGHFLHLELPDRVNELLLAHIDR